MGSSFAGLVAIALVAVAVGCSGENTADPASRSDSAARGTWEALPEVDDARRIGYQRLSAVKVGQRILIIAGVTYRQTRLEVLSFDLGARQWNTVVSPLWWRFGYSAIATDRELIVWGGRSGPGGSGSRAQGVRYDPAQREWRPMARSPLEDRAGHSSVWTGEEMIVWGGDRRSDGAAYDPASDSWRAITAAPLRGRSDHTAIWTGDEMVVWGGATDDGAKDFELLSGDGAAYDPETDAWRRIATAPVRSREGHKGSKAVWTGNVMLVWNGTDGAAYDPDSDTWRRLPDTPLEGARYSDTAVWTGEEMIVWGGDPTGGVDGFADGAAYNPAQDRWLAIPQAPIEGRYQHAAVWTGEAMMVWGGCCHDARHFGDGALYGPSSESKPITLAPPATFDQLPAGWRQFNDRGAILNARGGVSETFATSWRYEQSNPHGPAGDMPPGGILVSVLLIRRAAGGRPSPELCRGAPRLPSSPPIRRLPLRLPTTPATTLEGYDQVPEYRIFGAIRNDYHVEVRIDINHQDPPPTLRHQAQAVLDQLRFPDWPNRC
jgi:hypothetical protein